MALLHNRNWLIDSRWNIGLCLSMSVI